MGELCDSPLHFVGLRERHLGHLVRVGSHLELTDLKITFLKVCLGNSMMDLGVERKVIESHGTDEVDVGGLRVHDLLISGDPQPRVFRQHLHHLERLQVVDEDVRQPKLFDQLQVDGNESIRSLFWKFVCLYDD